MNDANLEPHDSATECPEWCEMHIDGRHVGALNLETSVNGSNIYTRLVGHDDGEVGFEVVVAQVAGTKEAARVELTPEDIAEHAVVTQAMEADLRNSLAALENGTPVDDTDDRPNQ